MYSAALVPLADCAVVDEEHSEVLGLAGCFPVAAERSAVPGPAEHFAAFAPADYSQQNAEHFAGRVPAGEAEACPCLPHSEPACSQWAGSLVWLQANSVRPPSVWLRLQALVGRPKQTDSGCYERLALAAFALR